MDKLELKIPPPLIALIVAGVMWGISLSMPLLAIPNTMRIALCVVFFLIGLGFDVVALTAFRRQKTTFNPMKPENSSALVSSGIYKVSRNPMYLASLFMLLSWAVYLSSAWSLFGLLLFVLFINRFQIEPEERVLQAKYGESYTYFKSKVRRWL